MTDNWRNVEAPEGMTSDDVNPGPAPMLQWIKIASLVIDDSYQRPLERKNWNAIRKIAMNFQWSRFSPVFVAPVEGGRYAIIDGQHRTHAAAACGIEQVPCQVVQMNLREQAAAFAAVNGNVTQVTIWQIFKAALAAGEKWATTARDVASDGGCRLMTRNGSSQTKKPGEIYGVRMFCEIVEKYQHEHVVAALRICMQTEGLSDTADAWSTFTIKPILHALCQRPKAMARSGFGERFRELDFWALEDQIAQENRRRIRAGSPPIAKNDQMEAGILEWIDKAFPERVALPGQAA
jgi:hypothetical protein